MLYQIKQIASNRRISKATARKTQAFNRDSFIVSDPDASRYLYVYISSIKGESLDRISGQLLALVFVCVCRPPLQTVIEEKAQRDYSDSYFWVIIALRVAILCCIISHR